MGWDVFSLDYTMDGPLKTVFFQHTQKTVNV